jgi:histidinol dehydrogenase
MRILRGIQEVMSLVKDRSSYRYDDVPKALAQEVWVRSQEIFGSSMTVSEVVNHVIQKVRYGGDVALEELTESIEGFRPSEFEVSRSVMAQALDSIPRELRDALELAAHRVAEYAKASLSKTWHNQETGLGELIIPIERVGLYAPGGTAAYPSTVLMSAVTAREAGVGEIVLCTPAQDAVNGNSAVLAAAYIAGADRVFLIGGAQAIAAMAYGTESVPKVDKICGPGNIFVTMAKAQLYGTVGIDGIFGPSETVVVADDSADPGLCAADLLAQAEHDVLAAAIFITTSETLLGSVAEEIETQVQSLERREIASTSLSNQSALVLVEDMDEALNIANLIAPEHLCLMMREPWTWVAKVRHAGGLFVGEYSAEVMGDYIAGPSHTIPTHGTARFASYLGVDQFVKRVPVVALDQASARKLAPSVAVIARAERLTGHARAAEKRFTK